jgi:L-asparaginase II
MADDLRVLRGDELESTHAIHAVAAEPDGRVLASHGDRDRRLYLRSTAKPYQALPLVASGAAHELGLTDGEVAVACASHNGEAGHVEAVQGILDKAGLDAAALQCGTHDPFPEGEPHRSGENTPLRNNCSGKHASFLAAADHIGASTGDYLDPDHPVQRKVREIVAQAGGLDVDEVGVAVDGCGAPVFHVPLEAGARLAARLADPSGLGDLAGPLERVVDAIEAHPWHVAGTDRFDTDLATSSHRLVPKVGAEGVQLVANRNDGAGLMLKVADGARRGRAPATMEALRQLGWVDVRAFETLGDYWRPPIRNHAGQVVGGVEPDFELAYHDEFRPRTVGGPLP